MAVGVDIKSVGTAVHAKHTIPAAVVQRPARNIKVCLFTGRNATDDAKMIALRPYGVVVDDVGKFQDWRDASTGWV